MILATDVQYDETNNRALAAGVVFKEWGIQHPEQEYTCPVQGILPYEPGSFYKRELPCLLALRALVLEPLDIIIVDGYVDLAPDHPGLGRHLYNALGRRIAVVGVAKTHFEGSAGIHVLRGGSKSPIYVTAAGMDIRFAAYCVLGMHGPYRIPTLLKRADTLARGRFA